MGKVNNSDKLEGILQCTPLQKGMLYHKLLNEDSTEYILQNVIELEGNIQVDKIRESILLLTDQFQVLKSAFLYRKVSKPLQLFVRKKKCEVRMRNLCGETASVVEQKIQEICEADVAEGFDLEKDSLLRVTLVSINSNKIAMVWTTHHVLIDGWCLSLIFSVFLKNYESLMAGCSVEQLREEASKNYDTVYEKYVKWIYSQNEEEGLNYWKTLLEGYDNAVGFDILSKPISVQKNESVKSVKIQVKDEIVNRLQVMCKANNWTMGVVLETVWGIVLQKYNRTNDVVFGKVVSGRNVPLAGMEMAVGLFINTIPVRVQSADGISLSELVSQNQKQSIASSSYEHFSLSEVQNQTSLKGDLINTLFVYENYYVDESIYDKNENLKISMKSNREETNYGIAALAYLEDELCVEIMYKTGQYRKEDASQILSTYNCILEQLAMEPGREVSNLENLLEEEKNKIFNTFNNTELLYEENKTMVDLFEEQVAAHKDKTAVVYKENMLTYQELNERANQIAFSLLDKGIEKEELVIIIAERSLQELPGIWGILKAGAAFVPVEPSYPEGRIRDIIEDSNPKVVVTCLKTKEYEDKIDHILEGYSIRKLPIEDSDTWAQYPTENPCIEHSIHDLAYCIFTSGTTGKPKGVLVEHWGVGNLREYFVKVHGVNEQDRVMQFASFAFDAMISEMTMGILTGATLFILPDEVRNDTKKFEAYIEEQKITIGIFPPQFLSQIHLQGMQTIITAGSETNYNLVMEYGKNRIYSNDYGPTEATVCATYWKHEIGMPVPDKIPIGIPMCNKKIYILEKENLCGIGMPGEICIGGIGLARGYLNRPELTSQKFIDNPFGDGKIYRTGDLGRWLEDGNIEFLGRIDEQVKIRGFRIELQEIEQVIRMQPGVQDAVVVAREDRSQEKNLYAYVVGEADLQKIKEGLKKKLPDYMVPPYMMMIDEIPVTKNGKLDRRALPDIEDSLGYEYVAPRNQMEEMMASIFSEVLVKEKVGIKDDFFDIGGHSLKATIAVNQIEVKTGHRISLQEFLQCRTPEKLAEVIGKKGKGEFQPIPEAEKSKTYEATSAQKRIYLAHELEPMETAYNLPAVLKVETRLDRKKVEEAFLKLSERHEAMRTRFVTEDGILMQYIEEEPKFKLEYEEVETMDEHGMEKMAEEFIRPFAMDHAPLFRAKLVQTDGECLLMTDMHHIITDGMSMEILQREFANLYNEEELPEKSRVDYHDYSEWMSKRKLDSQKEYWVNLYKGDIPVLELTADYKRGRTRKYEGGRLSETVRNQGEIETLARKTGVTGFVVMLGALMVTLGKYARQEDIVVGSPVSGRVHADTECLVGMFANTLAFRGKPEKDKSAETFLKELGQTCAEGIENQEYSLEELAEEVCTSRDLARSPLFDVMFAMEEQELGNLKLGGRDAVPLELGHCMGKFELTLNVIKQDGMSRLDLIYSSDLYKESSVRHFLSCYLEVLGQMCQHPEQNLGDLSVISKADEELILGEFNDTEKPFAQKETVMEIFEERVAEKPDAIAVEYRDKSLTYGELNAKANGLGKQLRAKGIGCDDFVGIVAQRSLEMIEGIYGILKAGGAYVPIDPDYPEERISYILSDCNASVVLVYTEDAERREKAVRAAEEAGAKALVFLDKDLEEETENLPKINRGDSLVYCIYTSGTTGKPKGVMNCQKGLRNRILWMDSRYPIGEEDCILQKTTYTFDVSVWEIIWWSLKGARLVMLENGEEKDPHRICKTIREKGVTVIHFVPSMLDVFEIYLKTSKEGLDKIQSLKWVFASGEALKLVHVNTFYSLMEEKKYDAKLINVYGPTEASIDVTYYDCHKGQEIVPIGKPISNIQMYVVQDGKLCGIGMPGEICIGGVGLARGYLNRPELTSQKFIDNPFGDGKIYRTGDLGRWLEDGNIEFLGRIDEQVKIRGFRIELQEIEQVIRMQPGVQDAVVVAREDRSQEKNLYAYVVGEADLQKIKEGLKKKLPDYMVPPYMMMIDEIPVTKNGKLDRRALPNIEDSLGYEYVAPETEIEKKVAEVCESILGTQRIGRNDTFMERGGNSIKAARFVMEVNNLFHIRIPFSLVFEYLTIQELSEKIQYMMLNQTQEVLREKVFSEDEEYDMEPYIQECTVQYLDLFCKTVIRRRLAPIQIASFYLNIRKTALEINFYEEVDRDKLNRVWNQLVEENAILCAGIDMSSKKMIQYRLKSDMDIPYIDERNYTDKQKGNIQYSILQYNTLYDREETYDGQKILAVPYLLRLDEKYYKLIIVCSHLIMDGYGKDILGRRIEELYRNESNSIEKPVSTYDDYLLMVQEHEPINDNQFNDALDMRRFEQACKKIQNMNIKFKELKVFWPCDTKNESIEQQIMEIGMQVFGNVCKQNYEVDEIPFLAVLLGRTYEQQSFYNVIGECLDVVPVIMDMNYDTKQVILQLNDKMEYLKMNNVNFIGYCYEKNEQGIFDMNSFSQIPLFNYLALFDDSNEVEVNITEKDDNKEKLNINIVRKRSDGIEFIFQVREDKWKETDELVKDMLKNILNKE